MRRLLIACLLVVVAGVSACSSGGSSGAVVGSAAALNADGLSPKGDTIVDVSVTRVVDGDTIHVDIGGQDTTVRLIGVNTPETVKPDSPVECFGPQASEFTKSALTNKVVTLELDGSQGRTDRYGRTLAYVWLPAGKGMVLLNRELVEQGFAEARQYGPNAYAWKSEFDRAEQAAQQAGIGMWGACSG